DHHVVRLPQPAVGVVVNDADRGVLLLRRHRFITDTWGWEIPAARVHPGEPLEQAAEREAIEETGWRPLDLEYTGFSHPTNGLVQQRFEYFLSPRAERVGEFDRTETESIPWLAPADVRTLPARGGACPPLWGPVCRRQTPRAIRSGSRPAPPTGRRR